MSKLLIVAGALLASASPAVAGSAEPAPRSVTISLAHYRLDQPRDAEAAHRAIRRAVRELCYVGGARSLNDFADEQACRAQAMGQVAAQVRAPRLLALMGSADRRLGQAGRPDLGIRTF